MLAGCAGGGGSFAAASPAAPSALATSTATASPASPAAKPSVSARPTATPAATDIQALIDDERTTYGALGALAVVRVGDERWAATSGTADRAGTPIKDTTRFRIASITKPIVATLVLEQVAKGHALARRRCGQGAAGRGPCHAPGHGPPALNHTSGIFDESNDGDPIADVEKLKDPTLRDEARALVKRYVAGERVIASDRIFVALSKRTIGTSRREPGTTTATPTTSLRR